MNCIRRWGMHTIQYFSNGTIQEQASVRMPPCPLIDPNQTLSQQDHHIAYNGFDSFTIQDDKTRISSAYTAVHTLAPHTHTIVLPHTHTCSMQLYTLSLMHTTISKYIARYVYTRVHSCAVDEWFPTAHITKIRDKKLRRKNNVPLQGKTKTYFLD